MAGWKRNHVVVPIDFSEPSFAALSTALEMVDDPGKISVIHVLDELSPMEPGEMWETVTDESRINNVLKSLRQRLTDDGVGDVKLAAVVGDAGHCITEFAEKENADAIVMPSKGTTGIKRLLIGSVAERVVRLAHCPVVVLRH